MKKRVIVITGIASGIGKAIGEYYQKQGDIVCGIDIQKNDFFVGDLAQKETIEMFADQVIKQYGRVDALINNAIPLMRGIDECSYEDFEYAQKVGVIAPYYLSKLFKPFFTNGASIINMSSSRDRMSQPQTESYTAAKGGIHALTHALAISLGPKVRVNSISPGWIETNGVLYAGADSIQQPCGRVGTVQDVVYIVDFLISEKATFITGENICVDGGMTKLMIYHNDNGWHYDC